MSWAEELFKTLTLEEKVGQVIINRGLKYVDSMEQMLREGKLGGIGAVVIRQVCKNDGKKLNAYINKLLKLSKIPPMMYLDAEAGISDMFGDLGTPFPSQMAIAATGDTEYSYKVGKAIGKEAKVMGFDMVSNPVLDVNSNPQNPIIGIRAFADDVQSVIDFGEQYVNGMQSEKIIPTGKHFPGHGDTAVDSHMALPTVDRPREYLDNVELKPFRELIAKGMKGIMTAHIYYPALQQGEDESIPATLSKKVMTDLIKKEWGFKGLIVSDSLTMKAVKDKYGIEKGAILAFKAGNDMILQDYNSDPIITFNALLEAAKSGEIPMEQLDDSVLRILKFKEWCMAHQRLPIPFETMEKLTDYKDHKELSKEVAKKSVTVLENNNMPIPKKDKKVLTVAVTSDAKLIEAKDLAVLINEKYYYFYNSVKRYAPDAELLLVSEDPTKEQLTKAQNMIKDFDEIIFVTFVRILSYKKGSGTIPESQAELLNILNKGNCKVTTVIAGNPYVADKLPLTDNVLLTYCDNKNSLDAAADILFGNISSQGKLPVRISDKYVRGYGL